MWLQSNHINVAGKSYSLFAGYLKDCKFCPLRQQYMHKPPTKIGRHVQFFNHSLANVINYTDKMKIKIDSSQDNDNTVNAWEPLSLYLVTLPLNKGMNKFTLRGQEKVNTQWQMYCLVHNVEKLINNLY